MQRRKKRETDKIKRPLAEGAVEKLVRNQHDGIIFASKGSRIEVVPALKPSQPPCMLYYSTPFASVQSDV
jgi:hypothetical protein